MEITVAVQCYNFQKRLCWMLASIYQQIPRRKGKALPKIKVDIAGVKGNGNPTVKEVIDYFRSFFESRGMELIYTEYPDIKRFQYRGLTRNDQLAGCSSDWIIFADSDMVYPPTFFGEMGFLLRTKYKNNPHCLYSRRLSTELEPTEAMINVYTYPSVPAAAWDQASMLPGRLRRNVGAGYFHLANVKLLRENHGGVYQAPNKKIDWSWETKYQKAKSDMHFRKRLGKEAIPLPVQIHLQHVRDNEVGKRLEVQR